MSEPEENSMPPKWARKILAWSCPKDSLEEVQGDLLELYSYWMETEGEREANKKYILNAIRLQRPFTKVQSEPSMKFNMNAMLKHFSVVAYRNVMRNRSFSFINIVGLSLGLATSLMILLWIIDERNVDTFHSNSTRLFRVYTNFINQGQIMDAGYNTPAMLPAELKKEIPEIEYATGFVKYFRLSLQDDIYETFRVGDKIEKLKGSRAEKDFFKMFDYKLLAGTAENALAGPQSLCVSRKMAELFFGSVNRALGKTVLFDGRKDLMVTAVFENVPNISTDQFDYLMNWDSWVKENPFKQSWGHFGTLSYIQLRPDADWKKVEHKMKGFLKSRLGGMTADRKIELGLQRFGNQYLHSKFENGIPTSGRIEYIWIFSGVAALILLIACINFMNLATARAVDRSREIAIRKVVGSSRKNLIWQFISEATLFTFLAAILAAGLVQLFLPWFNELTGKNISLPFGNPYFLLILPLLVIIVGLLTGSYPAFYLSSLKPTKILKGSFIFGHGAVFFRKGLVVVQNVMSVLLLIATLVISRQTNFIQSKNLGYDKENLVYIPLEGDLISKYSIFREEASLMPGIKAVDRCSQFPHAMSFRLPAVEWPGQDPNLIVNFALASVGYEFTKVMSLKVIEGRDFSREIKADSVNFLVNEEAVRQMRLKNPIGQQITVFDKKGSIVGVLKDYHTNSLRESIDPLVLDVKEHLNFGTILIRTQPGQTKEAMESLEKVCKKINPNYPFLYTFLDEQYGKLYKSEEVISRLANIFAILAIVISSMGLLGLAIFSAEQRKKEIGIRKVLGASLGNILSIFSFDFLRLVFLGSAIAIPIAWYAMKGWLQNFAYRIDLAWWIFGLACLITVIISILTIAIQAFKVGIRNPVESLRTE
jgi:putative ABC transport system permease protein